MELKNVVFAEQALSQYNIAKERLGIFQYNRDLVKPIMSVTIGEEKYLKIVVKDEQVRSYIQNYVEKELTMAVVEAELRLLSL